MKKGLMAVVAAATVFAGVARAEPAEFSWPVQRGCPFLDELQRFSGTKKADYNSCQVELKKDTALQLKVGNHTTEVEIFDVGADGLGHLGDYAIVSHKFKNGSKLVMKLECRERWKYAITSQIVQGTNCVAESEFDPSKEMNPLFQIGIRIGMGTPRVYSSIVYRNLVDASIRGVEPEIPYSLLDETFSKIEGDIPTVVAKKRTLNKVLYNSSDPLRRYAAQKVRELQRQRQILVPNSE